MLLTDWLDRRVPTGVRSFGADEFVGEQVHREAVVPLAVSSRSYLRIRPTGRNPAFVYTRIAAVLVAAG